MGIEKARDNPTLLRITCCKQTYILQRNPSKTTTKCASVSLSTSDKPESRSEMPVGSCTALSTVSSLTDRCHRTRPLEEEMTASTRSSQRRGPANTSQELCSLIWSLLSSTRSELAPTASCSTLNN